MLVFGVQTTIQLVFGCLGYNSVDAMIDFCMVLHSWDGTDIAISNETPSQQVVFVKAAHLEKEHIYIYTHKLYITFIQETTLMYMSTYVHDYLYIYIYI